MLIYKILSFFINIIGLLIAVSLLLIIPTFIAVPVLWLPMFLIIAVVLYTWFSNRFYKKVLVRKEIVSHSLRDWLRANGYVTIVFSFLNILSIISVLNNLTAYLEKTKEFAEQFGQQVRQNLNINSIQTIIAIMLVYLIALFVHVFWTFSLLKRNEEFID